MSKIKNKKQALIQRIKIVEKQILELQTILAVVWVDKKNDYKSDLNSIDQSKDFYWVVGDDGTVLKIDKVTLSIDKLEFDDILNFKSIAFITNTRGIFVGEFGSIYYTMNSGKKWRKIELDGFESFSLNHVMWYDLNTVYIVGDNGIFLKLLLSNGIWTIDKIPVVYSLDTTGRRIFIKDIEFADYNGDGVAKNFLTNAGADLTGFDTEVLRQVEHRLI